MSVVAAEAAEQISTSGGSVAAYNSTWVGSSTEPMWWKGFWSIARVEKLAWGRWQRRRQEPFLLCRGHENMGPLKEKQLIAEFPDGGVRVSGRNSRPWWDLASRSNNSNAIAGRQSAPGDRNLARCREDVADNLRCRIQAAL